MAELLLELLSEEIPARMQARAADDMRAYFEKALEEAGLEFGRMRSYTTPRRMTLVADGLPLRQPDRTEERKGPKVGAPEQAIEGFLKATGLTLDRCEQRETPKGPVWFAVMSKPGEATSAVLAEIVTRFVGDYRWPMSMVWADHDIRWVRPLQGILAMLDGTPVEGALSLGESGTLGFTSQTVGHRFLGEGAIEAASFADYADKLRAAHVILDAEERKEIIRGRAAELAAGQGLRLREDEALVAENAGLTEWPVPMMGAIDAAFMDVPPEVLITSMKTHQRYFALEKADGSLAPRFICVANTVASDGGAAIVAGNERVLRARLSDAKFFWDQDRKTKLADRAAGLADITFHADLGTMADKAARLEALAGSLAAHIDGCEPEGAKAAARLAKCDLMSGMVGEFPELQGIMGRYYALHDGQPEPVAQAVAEHYSPQGPSDGCPSAPLAVAVALADKLDTLAGFFAIGQKPTGSRDPFALRRAALGVIRLILENKVRLPLRAVFAQAVGLYRLEADSREVAEALMDFIADRLKVALRDRGVRHDLVDGVFALSGEDDLVRLLARVEALSGFLEGEDGANLLTAYRRAANISRIEAKKDGAPVGGPADAALFHQDEESALSQALSDLGPRLRSTLEAEDFAAAMGDLARLRGPVDAFFDAVTVNADEPALRRNRLALLSQITETMNKVADFSRIGS